MDMGPNQVIHRRPLTIADEAASPWFFEQYKIAVDAAQRITAARSTANSFFFTLQGALAAVLALLRGPGANQESAPSTFALLFASVVGFLLSVTWLLLLRSYRALSSRKLEVG